MRTLKIVLLGIALILFGALCLGAYELCGAPDFFEMLGYSCPIVGIIIAAVGAFVND